MWKNWKFEKNWKNWINVKKLKKCEKIEKMWKNWKFGKKWKLEKIEKFKKSQKNSKNSKKNLNSDELGRHVRLAIVHSVRNRFSNGEIPSIGSWRVCQSEIRQPDPAAPAAGNVPVIWHFRPFVQWRLPIRPSVVQFHPRHPEFPFEIQKIQIFSKNFKFPATKKFKLPLIGRWTISSVESR